MKKVQGEEPKGAADAVQNSTETATGAAIDGNGWPVFRLDYDMATAAWHLGPYAARVSLTPVLERPDGTSINALHVLVCNNVAGKEDGFGNRLRLVVLGFDSNLRRNGEPVYAATYGEALDHLNANKCHAERYLRCTFDLSRLAEIAAIAREFQRRFTGKVAGGEEVFF